MLNRRKTIKTKDFKELLASINEARKIHADKLKSGRRAKINLKFKSEKEEADYWCNHSPLDHPNEFKNIDKPFKLTRSLLKKAAKRRKKKFARL